MPNLSDLTEQLLAAAKSAGAEAADALAVEGRSVEIDVRDGALEQAERSESTDIGLRVLIGQKQACVSASDVSANTINALAERAVAMAREAPDDPHIGLADPEQVAGEVDLAALELSDPTDEPSAAFLADQARAAEAGAMAVPGVTKIDGVGAGIARRSLHLAASNGFSGGYSRSSHSVSCVAITGEGTEMERDYFGDMRVYSSDLMDPAEIGRVAGERTVARAGAKQPPTGAFPVVYDERVSGGLIGHLVQAVNGQMIARGSSWLRDALGEQVLPVGLTLTENPLRPRVFGSRPFDGEGLASRPRKLVDQGVLTGWTLDLATARQLGLESTANASRGVSAPPSPSASNLSLTQGDQSLDDLLAAMGTGLYVTSLIGSSVNPTTGDYSRGASGFWVENGQIAYPVNECTLAGNLRDMLRSILPADDARTHLSRVVPSLLVEGLTIAGN